jgi:CBS domain-containing protein
MSRTVVTATPDTPLPDLVDEMVRHGISGIPIVDTQSRLVGIVTEADLMSKLASGGSHRRSLAIIGDLLRGHERRWESKATGLTAGEVMTTAVESARPYEGVRSAARRMVKRGVKRLPVVDRGRLVGIVSGTDVLRSMHRTDADLQAEIAAVLSDPARLPEVTGVDVSVADGIVTVRGSVRYPSDVPALSTIVWRFPGVVDVRVEATARESEPPPRQIDDGGHEHFHYIR